MNLKVRRQQKKVCGFFRGFRVFPGEQRGYLWIQHAVLKRFTENMTLTVNPLILPTGKPSLMKNAWRPLRKYEENITGG